MSTLCIEHLHVSPFKNYDASQPEAVKYALEIAEQKDTLLPRFPSAAFRNGLGARGAAAVVQQTRLCRGGVPGELGVRTGNGNGHKKHSQVCCPRQSETFHTLWLLVNWANWKYRRLGGGLTPRFGCSRLHQRRGRTVLPKCQ